jgi:hypothetical protein
MCIDHADGVLMARNSLVTRRGKLIPLVEQRTRLAEHQVNILGRLGLGRRLPPRTLIPSPDDLITEVKAEMATNGATHDDETTHRVISSDHPAAEEGGSSPDDGTA